eukprot:2969692-Lingulodinium_polyedra.AAC.1
MACRSARSPNTFAKKVAFKPPGLVDTPALARASGVHCFCAARVLSKAMKSSAAEKGVAHG